MCKDRWHQHKTTICFGSKRRTAKEKMPAAFSATSATSFPQQYKKQQRIVTSYHYGSDDKHDCTSASTSPTLVRRETGQDSAKYAPDVKKCAQQSRILRT